MLIFSFDLSRDIATFICGLGQGVRLAALDETKWRSQDWLAARRRAPCVMHDRERLEGRDICDGSIHHHVVKSRAWRRGPRAPINDAPVAQAEPRAATEAGEPMMNALDILHREAEEFLRSRRIRNQAVA